MSKIPSFAVSTTSAMAQIELKIHVGSLQEKQTLLKKFKNLLSITFPESLLSTFNIDLVGSWSEVPISEFVECYLFQQISDHEAKDIGQKLHL